MKRILALLLALVMLLSFAACSNSDQGKNDDDKDGDGTTTGSTASTTQAPKVHTIEMFVMESMGMEHLGKTEYVRGSVPQEYWGWYESEFGTTYEDVVAGYEAYQALRQENDDYRYGTNYTLSYTLDKVDPILPGYTLEAVAAALAEQHPFVDESKVTDVKELVITFSISGDKDSSTGTFGFSVVQYDGRWYSLVYSQNAMGKVYANFSSTAFR